MEFTLISGTINSDSNMSGWIITSKTALVKGAEDIPLLQNDRINCNGDVYRDDIQIGNVS